MKQSRLDQLADGIFAIVMTLLVFTFFTPISKEVSSNADLISILRDSGATFLSYVLSFLILFTYWRAHHYIASVLAKSINNQFTNINAMFLLFVALIPFSAHFLSQYHNYEVAIGLYGLNVILIGLSLYAMRAYAWESRRIENEAQDATAFRHGTIRIVSPIIFALLAILVSFYGTIVSLLLFTLGILFNLSNSSATITDKIITPFFGRAEKSRLYARGNTVDR